MKFDNILHVIGEFGPYQKRIYLMLCIPSALSTIASFLTLFTLAIPGHRCRIPSLANDSYAVTSATDPSLFNASIPYNEGDDEYDSCSVYAHKNSTLANGTSVTITTVEKCRHYVYDTTYFTRTLVTEENLVCDKVIYRSNGRMLSRLGRMVGAIAFGILSDKIGRKKTMMVSFSSEVVVALVQAWSVSYPMFATFAFIYGFASGGKWQTIFVLGLELVGPSKRVWAGIVIEIFYPFGELFLAGMAYAIRDWRILQTVLSFPIGIFLIYWWFIPESPRWLISKRRFEEAEVTLKKIAESNGTNFPEKITEEEEDTHHGLVISAVWYGLSLNSGNLSGSPHLNFMLTALAEIPGYCLCLALLDRVGRRSLHCSSMLFGGIACILAIFPALYGGSSLTWLVTLLTLLGKMGASAAFAIIYVFTAELFPTKMRTTIIGVSSMFAGIGDMIAPYLSDLGLLVQGKFDDILPVLISGIITVVGGLLALMLPETAKTDLPETIEDAKEFGRKRGSTPTPKLSSKYTHLEEDMQMNVVDMQKSSLDGSMNVYM